MSRFRVTIYYKEPLFSSSIGKDPNTIFNSSFDFEAENSHEAQDLASEDFVSIAEESSVKWERKIVRFEVNEVTEVNCLQP
jgi:hypothetical protein